MALKAKPRYAVGLDVGSSRVRCVISVVENNRLRFLGAGSAPSQGWNRGRVADPNAISRSIQAAVKEAETTSKTLVDSVVLGLGGLSVEGDQGRGVYEFGRPREIGPPDLTYAVRLASRVRLRDDRALLHVFPQDFTVDGRAGFRNPAGMICSRLESNVLLLTVSEKEHDALISAVHQAHLSVEDTVYEPVAAAYAGVLPEERTRGAAIVDLGLDSTGMIAYEGDAAAWGASLPACSDHMTRDIVVGLHHFHGITVAYEDAESIKRDYGCAVLGLTSDNALIDVPTNDGRAVSAEVTRRELNEILEARAEEIFLFVRKELERVGMERGLVDGVFLTGGGARLTGMLDMAERVLNCPARFALATGIQDWPENFQDPAWTTAAGLSMYSARLSLEKGRRRRPPGPLRLFGW